jgi:sulfonate transport system substrate-binding protein
MPLVIGVHPNNLHLRLAARWPGAFEGLDATFASYDEGRETGRLVAEGRIDVGGTGSTPPILDHARGLDVLYLAASAPRPANGAVLVRAAGGPEGVVDLAGRRVALLDGSFHTFLLARVLEGGGLGLRDIERVELGPDAARAALAAGDVDAWVAMAPLLGMATASGEARVLATARDVIPNRSVFWTLARRGIDPATAAAFVERLAAFGTRIAAEPDRAADVLAGPGADAGTRAAWLRTVVERDWRIAPAGPEVLAEQRAEAETLHRHGDLTTVPVPRSLHGAPV